MDLKILEQITVQLAVNGIIWLDTHGRIKHVNPAACEILGYPYEILLKMNIIEIDLQVKDLEKLERRFIRPMKKKGELNFTTYLSRRSGRQFPAEVTTFYIKHKKEELICSFFFDISARRQLEAEAQKYNDRIQAIFNNHFQFTGLLNVKGRLLMVNKTALDYFDLDEHSVIGLFFWETPWFSHSRKLQKKVQRYVEQAISGEFVRVEFEIPDKSGSIRVFDNSIKPIRDEDGVIQFVVPEARDITEIKQTERELKKANQILEQMKDRLQDENVYLREELRSNKKKTNLVGQSHAFKNVLYQLEQVAETNSTVMILGETGTGKELVAHTIHELSARRDSPLVKLNCAAMAASLIESELFGHEKGAFTGAHAMKKGRFELADKGTLFLDEIGELAIDLQAKLLRVLQENEFERVGGTKTIKVDIRIIVATNRDLKAMTMKGKFREDLYYRLHVFPVNIPPLRDRIDDIPLLSNFLIRQIRKRIGKEITGISKATMNKLKKYHWPGNIRELENVLERAAVLNQGKILSISDWFESEPDESFDYHDGLTLDEVQRNHILRVLKKTKGRVRGLKGAARILGLKPTTLEYRMKKLEMKKPKIP